MLPGFVIAEIMERERQKRSQREVQPTLQLPIPEVAPKEDEEEKDDVDRGVVTINLF